MAKSKYSIVKTKTGKSKKVVVAGVKKVLYKKEGSMKMYVLSKGKMMNLVKYKKMKMKGGNVEQDGGKKKRKVRRCGGGDSLSQSGGKIKKKTKK